MRVTPISFYKPITGHVTVALVAPLVSVFAPPRFCNRTVPFSKTINSRGRKVVLLSRSTGVVTSVQG